MRGSINKWSRKLDLNKNQLSLSRWKILSSGRVVSPDLRLNSSRSMTRRWESNGFSTVNHWHHRQESTQRSLLGETATGNRNLRNEEIQIRNIENVQILLEETLMRRNVNEARECSSQMSSRYVVLTISSLRYEDSGVYMIKATNAKGDALSTATLKVCTLRIE